MPIALLLTAGTLAWYHLTVYREDRAVVPDEKRPVLREVILVCADGGELAEAISTRTGASVRPLRVVAAGTFASGIDDVLAALEAENHQRVVVVAGPDQRFDLMPMEG